MRKVIWTAGVEERAGGNKVVSRTDGSIIVVGKTWDIQRVWSIEVGKVSSRSFCFASGEQFRCGVYEVGRWHGGSHRQIFSDCEDAELEIALWG